MGISISIDDFGTGYSSLSYLRQFPIDRLKIDRAFVKDIPDGDDGVIAASIIVLAKALGIKVLAEGVETDAHIDFLEAHDCDQYQGYYLSHPCSAEEVTQHFNRSAVNQMT
jgi:EAL domain-containing protein (putative c-di-GMP-specific phosphodiesterase class I)